MIRVSSIWPFAKLLELLRYSYWVVPAMMAVASLALAFGILQLDRQFSASVVSNLGWFYVGGSEGAREVLSVIAGSMITVAGVVFSITLVALTLASSQFGPRVLRSFMEDRGSQMVLGVFIASFVYSLTVLRTIRGGDTEFVPQISVTVSFVLALVSLGFLIYFIHHVVSSIQASQIVAHISKELLRSIDDYFPESNTSDSVPPFDQEARVIQGDGYGYLQSVNEDGLINAAKEADVVLQFAVRPGEFVSPHIPIVHCMPAERCTDELAKHVARAFKLGNERSHTQDILFGVDQLVEVAVRALSPGTNDPFTAIRCLDWLAAGLSRRLQRGEPVSVRRDGDDHIRLVLRPVHFSEMLKSSFEQIEEYGRRSAAVTEHILTVLCQIAPHARSEEHREAILEHARQLLDSSRESLVLEQDRQTVEKLYHQLLRTLGTGTHDVL